MNGRMPYNEKMFATIFRRKEATVQLALKTFEEFGMIEIIEGAVTIPNWGKHQNFDKIETKNAYMKEYMRTYRSNQKLIAIETNSKTNSKTNVSEAEEIREDKNRIDKSNISGYKSPTQKFIEPTIDQVKEYCLERKNNVDAQKWHDFYTCKGWMVGKNKMKDWKAAVRTWEEKNENKTVKREVVSIPDGWDD